MSRFRLEECPPRVRREGLFGAYDSGNERLRERVLGGHVGWSGQDLLWRDAGFNRRIRRHRTRVEGRARRWSACDAPLVDVLQRLRVWQSGTCRDGGRKVFRTTGKQRRYGGTRRSVVVEEGRGVAVRTGIDARWVLRERRKRDWLEGNGSDDGQELEAALAFLGWFPRCVRVGIATEDKRRAAYPKGSRPPCASSGARSALQEYGRWVPVPPAPMPSPLQSLPGQAPSGRP